MSKCSGQRVTAEGASAVARVVDELLQDVGAERVDVGERDGGGDVDVQRSVVDRLRDELGDDRGACVLEAGDDGAAVTVDEVGALDADLVLGTLVLERRGAEAAGRRHQRDLVVRLAGGGDELLGDGMERAHRRPERGGERSQGHAPLCRGARIRYTSSSAPVSQSAWRSRSAS